MKAKYRKFNRLINSDLGKQLAFLQKQLGVRRGIKMMNIEFKFSKFKKHQNIMELKNEHRNNIKTVHFDNDCSY